ncbi:MAG: F0F1 ATP synthase subunit A [Candidatus Krumholzibacteria bacterium]|nr:F0F1 ATP synthase subunit A [Candidatus Krumholzibacteria bacterium]
MYNIPAFFKSVTVGSEPAHGGGGESVQHELPNLLTVVNQYLGGTSVGDFLHKWENVIFSLIVIGILVLIARLASRNPQMVPRGLQNVTEMVVEELEKFIVGVIGPQGRKFVPFLGTLFLYILFMNFAGLVPLMKASTSSVNTTIALALCVFFYVQFTALRENGIVGYVDHLMGQPRTALQWAFVPLMLPIHVIGELAKPLSLSLRLFGNVTGEDILILIFVGLGVTVLSFTHLPVGIPLQVPFIFLALLTSFIQALVFMLLSTIYFALMLPHEEGEHH